MKQACELLIEMGCIWAFETKHLVGYKQTFKHFVGYKTNEEGTLQVAAIIVPKEEEQHLHAVMERSESLSRWLYIGMMEGWSTKWLLASTGKEVGQPRIISAHRTFQTEVGFNMVYLTLLRDLQPFSFTPDQIRQCIRAWHLLRCYLQSINQLDNWRFLHNPFFLAHIWRECQLACAYFDEEFLTLMKEGVMEVVIPHMEALPVTGEPIANCTSMWLHMREGGPIYAGQVKMASENALNDTKIHGRVLHLHAHHGEFLPMLTKNEHIRKAVHVESDLKAFPYIKLMGIMLNRLNHQVITQAPEPNSSFDWVIDRCSEEEIDVQKYLPYLNSNGKILVWFEDDEQYGYTVFQRGNSHVDVQVDWSVMYQQIYDKQKKDVE